MPDRDEFPRREQWSSRRGLAQRWTFNSTTTGRLDRDASRRALDSLLIVDISTAQEWLGSVGRLTQIDLILPDGDAGQAQVERITAILPPGARLSHEEIRRQIADIGNSTLVPKAVEVRRVVSQSGNRAIAETTVELAFQFERDTPTSPWFISAVRLGISLEPRARRPPCPPLPTSRPPRTA